MEQSMESQEINIPLVLEDFGVGDRVYFVNGEHELELGVVNNLQASYVNFRMDNGKMRLFHINQFKSDSPMGKCFPVNELKVGSVISFPYGAGQRYYADIIEYVPGKYVEFSFRGKVKTKPARLEAEKDKPLDFLLAFYTLEG